MAPKAKPKPSPAAAAAATSPAVSIEDLFTSLNRHIQRSEYDQAVKVADQVLSISPSDEDALRCKVVALIKNDKIDEAFRIIQECTKKFAVDFNFLKAYCLYRQNKLDEGLDLLQGQEESSEILLLESQILYRLGKVNACVDIYPKLLKSKIESLEINVVAGLVSAGKTSEVQGVLDSLRVKATSSYELAYNTACSMIERSQYKDAEQLLLSAQRRIYYFLNLKENWLYVFANKKDELPFTDLIFSSTFLNCNLCILILDIELTCCSVNVQN